MAFIKRSAGFRLGVSRNGTSYVHALVIVDKRGACAPVSIGAGVPPSVRLLVPRLACGDLAQAPVYLLAEPLGGRTREAWLDANESRIIPSGASADAVVNVTAVVDGTIYSATVMKKARDEAARPPDDGVQWFSLSMPIWNLARLYASKVKFPFVLWKLTAAGSVLGLVEKDRLARIINCWISTKDITENPTASASEMAGFISQMSSYHNGIAIVLFCPEPAFVLPPGFAVPGHEFAPQPEFTSVPRHCHEAYANACFGDGTEIDFLPIESSRKSRELYKQSRRLFSTLRICIMALAASLLFFGAVDLVFSTVNGRCRGQLALLQAQKTMVKASEKRHAFLMRQIKEKGRFAVERTRVTELLAMLQSVFPENAWATELSVTENSPGLFTVDIQASALESALINDVLRNVRDMRGGSNARLVSSENRSLRDNAAGVKFKITFDWRNP
jgi:hypothetical protein